MSMGIMRLKITKVSIMNRCEISITSLTYLVIMLNEHRYKMSHHKKCNVTIFMYKLRNNI